MVRTVLSTGKFRAQTLTGGVGILFREGTEPIQRNLHDLGKEIKALNPDAIVITSGHFQSSDDTIEGDTTSPIRLYDSQLAHYFPVNLKEPTKVWHDFSFDWHSTYPHVYEYDYIHTSSATLGNRVLAHLHHHGIKARGVERDLDHGVYVYPPSNRRYRRR